jgi:hypothetical protein
MPSLNGDLRMLTIRFVYWQDDDAYLGYLLDYPDYWTQGDSFDELKENLADLYRDLNPASQSHEPVT